MAVRIVRPGTPRVPDEGVRRAARIAGEARRPVILADTQDNPRCGGTADTTGVLEALSSRSPRRSSSFSHQVAMWWIPPDIQKYLRGWTFLLWLLCTVSFAADDAPRLPCGTAQYPAYADPGAQPNVQVWRNQGGGAPVPPDCTGGRAPNFKLLVALAGSFRHDNSVDKLMERFGAVSATQGNRYWSVTDKEWRVLITHAVALEGTDSTRRRRDFTAAEMKDGKDLFFVQSDSRSTSEVVYRMHVQEYGPNRLVIEMENVSPVRFYFLTLFNPAELRSVHFLDKRAGDVWGYYELSATMRSQSKGDEASFVNRAAAFYRYVIGRPTDQDPPLAR